MLNLQPSLSRCALSLILILSLASSGCLICFPAEGLEGSPIADDAGFVIEPTPFGVLGCVDPIRYLFLVLMGFVSLEDSYTPGSLFLRPEPIGQVDQPGGHVALKLGLEGEVINTAQISSDVQAFDAILEPLGAAERRLAGSAGEAVNRRVFMSDADGQTVVVIDPLANQVVATIMVGRDPHGLAFSPDGSTLYVANNSSGTVSVVDVATLMVTGSLSLPNGGSPEGLAVTPDGAKLLVVNGADSGEVVIFDLADGGPAESIRVGRQPSRIRLTPDGSLAFVANFGANTISVIDTRTNALLPALNASRPADLAVSGDGNRLYFVSAGSIGGVTEVSIATLRETRTWAVGDTPTGIQLLPGETTLLVTNSKSPFVSLIDLAFDDVVVSAPAPEGLGPAAVLLIEDRPVLSSGD